jgi:hypothetical protein
LLKGEEMKKKCLTVFATVFLMASMAEARNVWKECGIGGMVFKKTGWAAVLSNVVWDLGSTATSSNISSDDLCEGQAATTAKFVNETYASIEEEVAKGNGEHISSLLGMLGCNSNQQEMLNTNLRSALKLQMSSADYLSNSSTQNAEKFYGTTMDQAKAAKCTAAL